MLYVIFAKWFGIISVILSLGILFNLDDARVMAKHMVEQESGYIMGGVLPVIFGSLALVLGSKFELNWHLAVTLVGIFMLIVGIYRCLFAKHWKKFMHQHLDKIPVLFSLFGLMLGLLLLYVGFIVPTVH